jgi:hypothetical protein
MWPEVLKLSIDRNVKADRYGGWFSLGALKHSVASNIGNINLTSNPIERCHQSDSYWFYEVWFKFVEKLVWW